MTKRRCLLILAGIVFALFLLPVSAGKVCAANRSMKVGAHLEGAFEERLMVGSTCTLNVEDIIEDNDSMMELFMSEGFPYVYLWAVSGSDPAIDRELDYNADDTVSFKVPSAAPGKYVYFVFEFGGTYYESESFQLCSPMSSKKDKGTLLLEYSPIMTFSKENCEAVYNSLLGLSYAGTFRAQMGNGSAELAVDLDKNDEFDLALENHGEGIYYSHLYPFLSVSEGKYEYKVPGNVPGYGRGHNSDGSDYIEYGSYYSKIIISIPKSAPSVDYGSKVISLASGSAALSGEERVALNYWAQRSKGIHLIDFLYKEDGLIFDLDRDGVGDVEYISTEDQMILKPCNNYSPGADGKTITITEAYGYPFFSSVTFRFTSKPIKGLKLNKTALEIPAESAEILKPVFNPEDTSDTGVTWTSSDKKIATVDSNGKVKGISQGTATITCRSKVNTKLSAACKVTVLFKDVTDKSKAVYKAVYDLAGRGIVKGYGSYFDVNGQCTRAQFVLFLWRYAGKPAPKSTELKFSDAAEIKALAPDYTSAIAWGSEKGIVMGFTSGVNKGKFKPNDPCTRGQVVLFLWRYKGRPSVSATLTFKDAAEIKAMAPDYTKAILWANAKKISTGYSDNTFRPNQNCTRGECVTFLYRM